MIKRLCLWFLAVLDPPAPVPERSLAEELAEHNRMMDMMVDDFSREPEEESELETAFDPDAHARKLRRLLGRAPTQAEWDASIPRVWP